MGLFNYVKFVPPIKCPKCKKLIESKNWQSKEPDMSMSLVGYWETNEFHEICENCKSFIEFRPTIKAMKEIAKIKKDIKNWKGQLR